MNGNIAALLYLVAGVLFILALRGLSSPATSRKGNQYGMIGMAVAVATTLLLRLPSIWGLILVVIGAGLGGGVGAFVAKRIEMTKMPQLVAFFHSLVGLAAVLSALAFAVRSKPAV
jgi:NAD(P) transhydrogenase subunit beta